MYPPLHTSDHHRAMSCPTSPGSVSKDSHPHIFFIDIIIYTSTFDTRMDENACSPYRRIRAKSSKRWNCGKASVGHRTAMQVED
jgi:hypothetical protein